jgi:hypothetical protein
MIRALMAGTVLPMGNPLNLDLVLIAALFLLGIVLTTVLALLGIKSSIRRSKVWRICLASIAMSTLLLVPVFLWHRQIEDAYDDALVRLYTFHPVRPTTFDGMLFPARSVVIENKRAPHEVTGGTVPDGTALLGLKIEGEFSIDRTGEDRQTPYLSTATLVHPGKVLGVPCGPGTLEQSNDTIGGRDRVSCTLASDYRVAGLTVPSGSTIVVAHDSYESPPLQVNGETRRAWNAAGVSCASGDFSFQADFTCVLGSDQVFDGYPLAAGALASLVHGPKGTVAVVNGKLSREFDIDGVPMPAGSVVQQSLEDNGYASTQSLRSHTMEKYQSVRFELPDSARLTLAGKALEGSYIALDVYNQSIKAHVVPSDNPEGEHNGIFDLATRTWCWDKGCPQ